MSAADREPWISEHQPLDTLANRQSIAIAEVRHHLVDAAFRLDSITEADRPTDRYIEEVAAIIRQAEDMLGRATRR